MESDREQLQRNETVDQNNPNSLKRNLSFQKRLLE